MERETLEVDILIVGGGPAGMSAALRLAQLQKERGGEPLAIAVLEKARETGAHMLSGAVLDPRALKDLVPDFEQRGAPLGSQVQHDHVQPVISPIKQPASSANANELNRTMGGNLRAEAARRRKAG